MKPFLILIKIISVTQRTEASVEPIAGIWCKWNRAEGLMIRMPFGRWGDLDPETRSEGPRTSSQAADEGPARRLTRYLPRGFTSSAQGQAQLPAAFARLSEKSDDHSCGFHFPFL